jgi:5'-phosphate synthase pdxT subunit
VAVREGSVLSTAFHPELTDDPRLHAVFMAMTTGAREQSQSRDRAHEEAET